MPEAPDGQGTATDRLRVALARTRGAVGLTLRRRDAALVLGGTTVAYTLAYLVAIGHLAPGLGGFGVTVVPDAAGRFLRPALGPLSFTPVARVAFGPVTYLFSLNTLIGAGVAALVGLNVAVTYLAWRQPKACGLADSSTGLLASVPALLSGTACCGPVALIALGIQASGVLLTAFQILLPAAVLLLLGSLVLVGRRVEPTRLAGTSQTAK
jgi:hypothetical protein